jgi:2'-5' RNA ligase
MKNAHVFGDTYKRLGIDLRDLGCLMIDTENPVASEIDPESEYKSPDPKKFWVNGVLDNWHATVRYGFLNGVTADDVDAVIGDMEVPKEIYVKGLEVFPSTYPDEQYDCLVALVVSPALFDLNTQLSVLPNVNTFPVYKPHVTIGYFKKGAAADVRLRGTIRTLGFDYGQNLPRA